MATKTVINPDLGTGFKYFEGSGVNELIHSAGVVVDTSEVTFVSCSGKTATNDQGETVEERDTIVGVGDIKEQTSQVLRNLQGTLRAAGATFDDVVRMRVFVTQPFTDLDFGKVHEARAPFFNKEHYPASTLVIVYALARPDALIEIDCDAAILKNGG
ncbi:MAG: RidA family protein [Actinomycetota bacterium]|jgi:enamine deaminase RidA (YjgF/YER057c/UK114 family)|nr:RidA family protein [Actinomycetota bacterium]